MPVRPMAVVAALTLASLLLRSGELDAGYWIDEAIAVGIAGRPLADIPAALRLDGSPPLYYVLLHGWMQIAGTGEAATRALSLLFAAACVPASAWAAHAAHRTRRAALAGAAGAAGVPFLTQYAQETRMYSLVVLFSLVVTAAFVLALLDGRRHHLITLAIALTGLLYTHNWGLFLAAGLGIAWLALRIRARVATRDGVLVAAAVAAAYAPWVPTLLFQSAHTAAPWAENPSPLKLLAVPVVLLGAGGVLIVGLAAWEVRRGGWGPRAGVLIGAAAAASAVGWLASQIEPAWSTRYLAVVLGPLLVGLAGLVPPPTRATAAVLAVVAVSWLAWDAPAVKSNVRTVGSRIGPLLAPGDVVLATAPESVPNLARYLPPGLVFHDPAGPVRDPRLTDWRDLVGRMERVPAAVAYERAARAVPPGGRLVLVTPVMRRPLPEAPLPRLVARRSRWMRSRLRRDPRFEPVATAPASTWPPRRSRVRALVVARQPGAAHPAGRTCIPQVARTSVTGRSP